MTVIVPHYGWRRDRLDPRDHIFNLEEVVLRPEALPSAVDLATEMPPIYDQGQLGSCTANAAAALIQHQQLRQSEAEGQAVPSRLFIYYQERVRGGYPVSEDTGAEIRDGITVLAKDGAPPEADWPYNIHQFAVKPPPQAYADAVKYEATSYQKIIVNSPGAPMRTAVYNHRPIAFGFQVPDYFEDPSWDCATTPLALPTARTNFIGGHAVVIVGYDWTRSRFPMPVFKVRNSWSAQWGENGAFYMPSEWFSPTRGLCDDLWVVKQVS